MPLFRYTVINAEGRYISGELEAAGAERARAELAAKGWRVESVESVETPAPEPLSRREVELLSQRVADVTQAELPLAPALEALAQELPAGRMQRALAELARELVQGTDLATALGARGTTPELRVLLAAGSRTGQLADVLANYAARSREVARLQRQTMFGIGYPLFLLALAGCVMFAILRWLVPDFRKIFEDFGTELPDATQVVLALSKLVVAHGGLIVIGLPAGLVLAWFLMGSTLGRARRRRLLYAIPWLGPLLRWSALSHFSDLLALMVQNGVPLPEALRLAGAGAGDPTLHVASETLAQRTEAGQPAAEAARAMGQFPASFVQSLAWSEHEGALPEALHAAAEMFRSRARIQGVLIRNMWEPLVVMGIGMVLGFTVISLFMPLVKLLNDLS